MPSHMPSSFAAAAGQGPPRESRNGRGDGRGSGDWVRKEIRAPNGTLTLRRSSTNPLGSATQGDALPTPTTEQPTATFEPSTDNRYSKNFLLDLYKSQQESGASHADISHLYANGWSPGQSNGVSSRSGWGKNSDTREPHAADVCWDMNGDIQPVSLEEMSQQEKILFAGDINSPIKPPPQNSGKDASTPGFGLNGRKSSISQGSSAFALSSPVSNRPSTRRQQTADNVSGLVSPGGTGRFSRDEPSPFFSRKPDPKDGDERIEESKSALPFGGLMRANTAGSALANGPASPWGPTSSTISPMGTFGSFAFPGPTSTTASNEKRPLFGRGESRFAQHMAKETTEEATKPADRAWRPRQRTDTDPFSDNAPSGSATLGDDDDGGQPKPHGQDATDYGASGDIGMSDVPGFRDTYQRGQSHQTPQASHGQLEPLSPSDTNPYRSPPEDRQDGDNDSFDGDTTSKNRLQSLGGIPEHGQNTFGTLPRSFPVADFEESDRSQTSSAAGNKAVPPLSGLSNLNLGGLGAMGGWPTSGHTTGTPDREIRSAFPSAFGTSLFGPMGDLQSPSLGGLGGVFGSGVTSANNTVGRGSKLGSLFPAAMQAQMQATENEHPGEVEPRQSSAFGAIGRNAFPPSRDTDSPMRASRHPFEDLFPSSEKPPAQSTASTVETSGGQPATSFGPQQTYQQPQASSDSASNQLPAAQQRMMVMPDRMRWVYLDPQGQVQGPFSGLEMHDWYKASFFTPDLSVKKLEDADFEPLGQLIRRIGNSREPFLVPQIGIPHGQPSTQAGTAFTPPVPGHGAAGVQPGAVQPPFASSFPSFGTTLTAEQQNNLERRKQEEQYLMARQREFLAQQQVNMKQMQMGGLPGALHHHSSAHSLQSQPSFGSMTSPIGMPPQPPIPTVPGFFDGAPRQVPSQSALHSDFFREEEFARLSLRDRHQFFNNTAPGAQQASHSQPFSQPFSPQETQIQGQRIEDVDFDARLQEFNNLRAHHDAEEAGQGGQATNNKVSSDPIGPPQTQQHQLHEESSQAVQEEEPEKQATETLSLIQRVQKAASAKQSPVTTTQPDSPWGNVNSGMPMPFPPPPQSTTPLPAPTARRNQSNLPEALNIESRSRSETPEVASATPSIAPWAKEPAEAPKALSLKEIQEAEAKKAAKAEETAAAVRRANYEQELKMLTSQPLAPAPGLPTTSTWGSSTSPAVPTPTAPAWAKSATAKPQLSSKKTLADIQRDEELRKAKLAAATAAAQSSQGITGGKRYADLASKPNAAVAPAGPAWSTVGAGGKIKAPTGPAVPAPQTLRSVSSATIASASSTRSTKPTLARSITASGQSSIGAAKDEFTKWAKLTLEKGLNPGINVNDFVAMLQAFPPEASIIADSVYSASQTIHGNDFATEFLRRRINAEKGIIEPANSGQGTAFSSANEKAGGWSEVAKKGPPKEEPTTGFKVVPNKKKGKK